MHIRLTIFDPERSEQRAVIEGDIALTDPDIMRIAAVLFAAARIPPPSNSRYTVKEAIDAAAEALAEFKKRPLPTGRYPYTSENKNLDSDFTTKRKAGE